MTQKKISIECKQKIGKDNQFFWTYFYDSVTCKVMLDENGFICAVNRKFEKITGFQESEVVGNTNELFTDKKTFEEEQLILREFKSKTRKHFEHQRKIYSKNGDVQWGRMNMSLYELEETNVVLCELLNKNELVKTKNELLILTKAMEDNPIGVFICSLEGEIIFVNKKYCEITGYTKQEIQGSNPRMFKSGRQSKEFYQNLWQTILSGKTWSGFMENKRKDSSIYWEKIIISPVNDENGDLKQFVAMKEDLTDQKRREKELTDSEKRFRLLAQNSSDAVALIKDDEIAYLSPSYKKILGFEIEELTKSGFGSLIHPEDKIRLTEIVNEDRKNLKEETRYDYRIKNKAGEYIWMEDVIKRTFSETGELLQITVNSRDITGRKAIEKQLILTNQRLKIQTLSRKAIIISDNEEELLQSVCNILTYASEFSVALIVYKIEGKYQITASSGEQLTLENVFFRNTSFLDNFFDVLPSNEVFVSDFKEDKIPVCKDARQNRLNSFTSLPLGVGDNFLGFVFIASMETHGFDENDLSLFENISADLLFGILSNRTKQASEKAKAAVIENERQLKEAQKIARLGNWKLDIKNNKLVWSDEIYRIFGTEPQSFQATFDSFIGYVHPDDREFVTTTYSSSIKNKEPYDIIRRVLTKHGKVKYVNEKCYTEYDENEEPTRSIGIVIDVTEQILIQQEAEKNKQEFVNLFQNMPIPLYRTSVDGKILMANKALLDLMQYESFEELEELDLNQKESTHSFERDIFLQEMKEKGRVSNFQTFWHTKNGKLISIEENAIAIKNKNDEIIYFEGSAVDISDRIKSIKQIKDKENQFRFLSNSATYLIALNSADEIIDYVAEVLSQKISSSVIVIHDINDDNFATVSRSRTSLDVHDIELDLNLIKSFEGEEFEIESDTLQVLESEKINYMSDSKKYVGQMWKQNRTMYDFIQNCKLTSAYDIGIRISPTSTLVILILTLKDNKLERDFLETFIHQAAIAIQRKKLEELILFEKHNAEQANKAKSEFLANVSHEIRTPLNAIIGFSSVLEKKIEVNSDLKHYTHNINRAGQNLLMIINDILDLSKIESGKVDIEYKTTNLKDLVNEVAEIFALSAEEKQLDFKIQYKKNVPELILIDYVRIRQVLFNLLGNAVKFTETGQIMVSVEYKGVISSQKVVDLLIKVSDTGIGIAENDLDRIFTPFLQKDGQSTRKYGGTGLGLPISKRLVEMMNGSIWFESKLGEGSTFFVLLEEVKVVSKKATNLDEFDETMLEKINFLPANILLVEDNDFNREFVINILDIYTGLKITEAEHGKEAFELIQQNQYDFILLDIEMPVMDGYTLAKKLRQEYTNPPPLVALTAYAMKDQREKYQHAFDEYLSKPIDWKQLVMVLAKYLDYNVQSVSTKPQKIDKAAQNIMNQPPETLKNIREKLTGQYNSLKQALSYKDARNFSKQLGEIAEKHQNEDLIEFNQQLFESLRTYNFEKAKKLLLLLDPIFTSINSDGNLDH